ncbi:hypothetical protein G6K93_31350 [Agrobacterium rhizogenes]|uniref:Uncharacterized protein n=1 Tax=Rhizobium rhizogenes TaxID=359 RepID=A0A7S4ZSJ8_RHIRH|nr:hypothetical protein [Rhizobium rhizogenes]NTF59396.1 hypothetical protein [Rhizobium rhizogenes]NTF78981.1 hypothetical protein [Rhizobium rhizogenes]NTJ51510.1 hypothetical protein [Rhizobium rhizogenes]QCL10272.1 hypothetical protein pC6.5b_378 [Rhizobium rhizogenes]
MRFDDKGHRAVVQYLGAPATNLLHRLYACGRLTEWRTTFTLSPLADVRDPVAQAGDVAAIALSAVASPGTAFVLDGADARVKLIGLSGSALGETTPSDLITLP